MKPRYTLPAQERDTVPEAPAQNETGGTPGRPRVYDEDTLPVSFQVPASLRRRGSEKRARFGFNLTKYLAVCYAQFVERPVEDSLAVISEYERAYGQLEVFDEPAGDVDNP